MDGRWFGQEARKASYSCTYERGDGIARWLRCTRLPARGVVERNSTRACCRPKRRQSVAVAAWRLHGAGALIACVFLGESCQDSP
jgi:hypothetical protein